MTGVYYLFDGAAVLYVGQSLDVEKRVRQHHADKQIDFSGYFVDSCEPAKLNELEAKAIEEFKPKYNVRANLQP